MTIHKSYNATLKTWFVVQNWPRLASASQVTEFDTERGADVFIAQCLEIQASVNRIGAL